jgi:membrane-associated protease RseP (regulator of RpoE activity)
MTRSYFRDALSIYCLFMAFHFLIAFHELGHAVAARVLGYRVRSISLGAGPLLYRIRIRRIQLEVHPVPVMGYTEVGPGGPSHSLSRTLPAMSRRRIAELKELAIALAGPLFSLLLGGYLLAGCLIARGWQFAASVLDAPGDGRAFTGVLCLFIDGFRCFRRGYSAAVLFSGLYSLGLGLTNLLPIPPMDGGFIVLQLVQIISGERLSENSVVTATALGILVMLLVSLCLMVSDVKFVWRRFRNSPTIEAIPLPNVSRPWLRERRNRTESCSP